VEIAGPIVQLSGTKRVRHLCWRIEPLCLSSVIDSICPLACLNTGLATGIESGGILFLETFVPFFITRLVVYKYAHLMTLSKTLLIISSVLALLALPEAISGVPIAHKLASLITGNPFVHSPEVRFGIWRSYSLTDHPIVLGSICATALPIGLAISRRRRLVAGMSGLSFFGVIASASSGPILSVVAQASLYIWSLITKGRPHKWWLLLLAIGLLYIFIDVLSNRDPFRVMFSYLLFSEHNGYVRYNMWINSFFLASQSFQSMLVGYGFSVEMMSLLDNHFWSNLMATSVDSYWLVILLRYGVTMLLLSVVMLILILRANIRNYRRYRLREQRLLVQAWFIATISLSLVACTVHFWGSTASLFFVVLAATAMSKKSSAKQKNEQQQSSNKSVSGTHLDPAIAY